MLDHVVASRFDKGLFSGRTKPCLAACQHENGDEIDMIIKFREGCDMKERSLLTEAIAAMLAKDLDLPVPEPFMVNVLPEFTESITDVTVRDLAQKSLGWNFGSKLLPPGYSVWANGVSPPERVIPTLAEILAFDIIFANDDRRSQKPNCLTNGNEVAIIDHEAAFLMSGIIG